MVMWRQLLNVLSQVVRSSILNCFQEQPPRFSEASANVLSITGQNRIARPYPPAHVLLNDVAYPATVSTLNKVSWRFRNRVAQGASIVDQLADTSALSLGVNL